MAYGSRRNLQNDRDNPRRDRRDRSTRRDRRDRETIRRERDPRRSDPSGRRRPPRESVRRTRRRLPPDLEAQIESDPAFQIVTLDGQTWIDPYTGEAVPAPEGHQKAATDYLLDQETWVDRQPLTVEQLTAIRWRYDLLRMLPAEPRLRIFGREGQGWLNPFNGDYVPTVSREEGRVTMRTVTAMAQVLTHCPQAQGGQMLDAASLQEKARASLAASSQAAQAVSDSGAQRPVQSADSGSHSTVFGLSDDLKRAQDVQANMLRELPQLDGWELAVHFSPHSGVSGDFYEVMPLPDQRFLLVLGDVSGHGMQAALVVATALKTLRLLAKTTHSLTKLIGDLNDEIKDDLLPGQFITLFAGIFDPNEATLTCVLAGHHQLLQINPSKAVMLNRVGRSGMAVGLLSGNLFRQSLKEDTVSIDQGDLLIQYTDGLIEAIDDNDEEYGLHRLVGSFFSRLDDNGQEILDGAVDDVNRWSNGNPDDDLTLLVISRVMPDEDDGD